MKKDVTVKKLKTKVSIEFSNEQYQALVDSVNNLDTALDTLFECQDMFLSDARNLQNIKQIQSLTSSIKNIFKDDNYPIIIDQEGGRINRLNKIISLDNFTAEYFGKLFIKNKKEFLISYRLYVDKISYLLNNLGININTVPVLDLKYKGSSNIIGDRSFSNNAKIASDIGDICIKYFYNNSIGTVIKHIPGHGLAKVDSHYYTPSVNKSLDYLLRNDFKAFRLKNTLFAMTAHIIFKKIFHRLNVS